MAEKTLATDAAKRWAEGITGRPVPSTGMEPHVVEWWGWMRAKCAFYDHTDVDASGNTFKVERITMTPGKMVCEDWASIVVNDDTSIGFEGDDPEAEDTTNPSMRWLRDWVEDVDLLAESAPYERAFGTGTAGWVLGLRDMAEDGAPNAGAEVTLTWHDARSIVPLAWDGRGVTECLFLLPVVVGGKPYTQATACTRGDGGYCIDVAFFDAHSARVGLEGFVEHLETGSDVPPFAVFSPAIDNTYEDNSPLGVSVLDRAMGAIKLADGAFDNAWKDMFLGQKMVFLSEDMLRRDEDGGYTVPRAQSQQLFMAVENTGVADKPMYQEYNPDLRVEDNRRAIATGLSLLGKRVGFGYEYYQLDKAGGLKTAKEVASSNAELLRNARKHERRIGPAIAQVCEAAVELARTFVDPSLPSVAGLVRVDFGDTVIQDDETERENDRADVAAGIMPAYRYAMKHHGVDEATAREWTGETADDAAPALPMSPEAPVEP